MKVAELENIRIRGSIVNGVDLLTEDFKKFAEGLTGRRVIELSGGMGEHAEYLAELGNSVSLVEEQRMCFVYRRQVWPNSKVIEMNIHPSKIKSMDKPFADLAIIHSDEFNDIARNIARTVYNLTTKEFYGQESFSIAKKPRENTKNSSTKASTVSTDTNDSIPNNKVTEPPTNAVSIPADNGSVSNMEQ